MVTYNQRKALTTLAIAAVGSLITACGSSNSTSLPQQGGGLNIPGIPGGCIPIAQQIGFTGTNIYFDWANIVGGAVPNAGQVGQMAVGGGAAGGPYSRTGIDGTISLNVQQMGQAPQTPYPGYPSYSPTQSKLANIQGFVQISPQTQSDIIFQVQTGKIPIGNFGATTPTVPGPGMPGYNPYQSYTPQVCVSGIAMNVGHYYNTIYGGNVYLYLNGTQRGYALYF